MVILIPGFVGVTLHWEHAPHWKSPQGAKTEIRPKTYRYLAAGRRANNVTTPHPTYLPPRYEATFVPVTSKIRPPNRREKVYSPVRYGVKLLPRQQG